MCLSCYILAKIDIEGIRHMAEASIAYAHRLIPLNPRCSIPRIVPMELIHSQSSVAASEVDCASIARRVEPIAITSNVIDYNFNFIVIVTTITNASSVIALVSPLVAAEDVYHFSDCQDDFKRFTSERIVNPEF